MSEQIRSNATLKRSQAPQGVASPFGAPDHHGRVFGVRQLLALCAILLTLVIILIAARNDPPSRFSDAAENSPPIEAHDLP